MGGSLFTQFHADDVMRAPPLNHRSTSVLLFMLEVRRPATRADNLKRAREKLTLRQLVVSPDLDSGALVSCSSGTV